MAGRLPESNSNAITVTDRAAIGPQPDNTPATGGSATGGGGGGSATVVIGTTTTLAPGSSATVTNSGTTTAAILNFGIPAGVAGTNGATWYTGAGAPSGGLGVNNDLYLNTTNDDVYKKTAGTWGVICNIKGATGATGANGTNGAVWYTGAGVPSGGLGVNDDFYLRNSNGDVYEKIAGSWTVVANITGPAGAPGTGSMTTLTGTEFSIINPSGPAATNIASNNLTPNTAAIGPGAVINGGMKMTVQGTQGDPTPTGTTEANGNYRIQTGNTITDIGTRTSGKTWFQGRDASNFSLHYALELNPLGGDVEIGGAAGQTFALSKPSATGAVLRQLSAHWGNLFNVEDYGASSGASAATNQTAIQAAIDAAIAGKGAVYIPFSYDINDAFTTAGLAGPFSIIGNAIGVSCLRQTVAHKGIIDISNTATNNNACVSLLNFQVLNTSGTAMSSASAFIVDFTTAAQWRGKNLCIENVSIGFETSFKSFTYGFELRHINEGSIFGVDYYGDNGGNGTAVYFRKTGVAATGPDNKCIACFISHLNAANCGTMIRVTDAMESVIVVNSLCGGCNYGLSLDYCIHVAITNCHLNAGINPILGTGTGASPSVNQLEVSNCDIYCQGSSTHAIEGSFDQFNIVGNTFYCSGGSGGKFIILNGNSGNGIITGNTFNCVDNPITTFVQLDSGCTNVRVTGNHFAGTPTNYYVNNGGTTNRVGEGVSISSVTTPSGGSPTHTVDMDISTAYMGNIPNNVPVAVQSQAAIGCYSDPTDGAQTKTNLRIVFFRFDGTNLAAVAFRYGVTVVP